MIARSPGSPLAESETPRRTFVPTPDGASVPRPTTIPASNRTGLFTGWGVQL
jgi:hypothetical protein